MYGIVFMGYFVCMHEVGLAAAGFCGFTKLLTGVRPIWQHSLPDQRQRVYFANHRSHGDFLTLWASLPQPLRQHTRPVAGADYWNTSWLRRYIANRVFRAVLINRTMNRTMNRDAANPVELMSAALRDGDSLIIFPEGTRNLGDDLLPFKAGIYHLAKAFPNVEFVPVWIENLGRVMPKGAFMPVPLLCTLIFGEAIHLEVDESRADFLARSRRILLNLAPLN